MSSDPDASNANYSSSIKKNCYNCSLALLKTSLSDGGSLRQRRFVVQRLLDIF